MRFAVLALPALLLAGCATTPINRPVEVLRYHLGDAQVARGAVALEAAGPDAGVEWRAYADAVAAELVRNGYTIVPVGQARYVATVTPQRGAREALEQGPSFSLGVGGGSYGRGGGVGGGVGVPIGGARVREIVGTALSVKLAERGSGAGVIWEGRAMTEADARLPDAAPEAAARKLAYALFRGFPGEFGAHYHGAMSAENTDIAIDAGFDGGNIRVVAVNGDAVDLAIVKDHASDFYQWFFFRAAGVRGRRVTYRILNCGESAYPKGWPGYRARVSHDLAEWRQAETGYADGVLTFTDTAPGDLAWFAYFAPYTWEMHTRLVARMALQGVAHRVLGHSLDGRAIDCFDFRGGAKQVWLYARQHPGESMCEYWMEGALDWLTSPSAQRLLAHATVHVVPNMNPDGTYRGHLRTNAAGVNLNREWHAPSPERSPEVLCVRDAMDATGVDWAMDVHGDEAIPANFLAGFEGIPSWTEAQGERFHDYGRRLAAATPEFQTTLGYEKSAPGKANLTMSTNQLAERFGATSMTLEMPFKDHDPNPDPERGWSPARSRALAAVMLEVLTDAIAA